MARRRRSLIDRAFERRHGIGSVESWARDVFGTGTTTTAGRSVTADNARQVATVWACQSLIADAIASLPIDVYRRTIENGRRRRVQVDAPRWIEQPNPFETPYSFWHKVMISLLGQDGNAFINTVRDSSGAIVSAFVWDPLMVDVDEKSATPVYRYNGVEYTEREVIHIPAFTVPGKRRGISVIDHAREANGLAMAAEEFGARFFSQGTTMSGVIQHPGTPKPGEVAIMRASMRKTHTGLKNSHAVGILTGGATWQQVSITPEQAQFLATRRFQNIEIAKLYRVPPHIIDPTVQSTWGSGIEEQNLFFATYTLVPWLVRLEQAITSRLAPGMFVKFNLDALLRAKLTERFAAYATAIQNGFMNPDEARDKEDYEPIPDGLGETFYRPANLVEMGAESEQAPATEPPAQGDGQGARSTRALAGVTVPDLVDVLTSHGLAPDQVSDVVMALMSRKGWEIAQ